MDSKDVTAALPLISRILFKPKRKSNFTAPSSAKKNRRKMAKASRNRNR